MTEIALISEGITDQAIIESILYCLTNGEAIAKPLRPLRDATDNSRVAKNEFSNWELVREYVRSEEILDAIGTNDFVVIQIDTDQCEHPNFGIKQGKTMQIESLVQACIDKILSWLPARFPKSERHRLIFAIPVLSSECWLVSLHDPKHKHTSKTINNCEQRLSKILKKSVAKEYIVYQKLSADFKKRKVLERTAEATPCLKLFTEQVKAKIATSP